MIPGFVKGSTVLRGFRVWVSGFQYFGACSYEFSMSNGSAFSMRTDLPSPRPHVHHCLEGSRI